jgi:hypothetical protein
MSLNNKTKRDNLRSRRKSPRHKLSTKKRRHGTKRRKKNLVFMGGNDDENACPICLKALDSEVEPLSSGAMCKHVFHSACINSWCESGNFESINDCTCPLCRQLLYEPHNFQNEEEIQFWRELNILIRREESDERLEHFARRYPTFTDIPHAHRQDILSHLAGRDLPLEYKLDVLSQAPIDIPLSNEEMNLSLEDLQRRLSHHIDNIHNI